MSIFFGNQGALIDKLEAGSDGRVSSAVLKDGSVVEADTVMPFISF
jgi:monodehydroascorbate reductase (NADH)